LNVTLDRIIEELQYPGAYPHPVDEIHIIQTHISVVFISGSKVYKVKKPVNFGFLDFTTLEKRKYFCEEELRLNRRLSPDIYLGVVPIIELDGKLRFGSTVGEEKTEGSEPPVEYAVLMERLDEKRLLSSLLERGEANEKMLIDIADRIAKFHKNAETSDEITSVGGTSAVEFNTEEDFQQIEPYIGKTLSLKTYETIKEYTRVFRDVNHELFNSREKEGWIRDGHGDLHTQHICLTDRIRIFDCIEFNQRFRFADILCDAAFLTMDLRRLGFDDLAASYTDAYLNKMGQEKLLALYNFYVCYRAVVRGKVEGFRSSDPNVRLDESKQAVKSAGNFFNLAEKTSRTLYPPTLFASCGLMGSGKSTLASGMAEKLDFTVIASDRIRKEIAGIDADEKREVPFGMDIYGEEFTSRTYDELHFRASGLLKKGQSVFIDATYIDEDRRAEAMKAAEVAGGRFILLNLDLDEESLKIRLKKRATESNISDGREDILADQIRSYQPPSEIPPEKTLVLEGTTYPMEMVNLTYRRALSMS